MKKLTYSIVIAAALVAFFAAPAAAETIEIGDIGTDLPKPSCPFENTCWVAPPVSGYQIQAEGKKNPMRVAKRGRVVAFTVRLGSLTAEQTAFFRKKFGGGASVRMAVLRPKPTKSNRYRFVLAGQSETFNVSNFMDSSPTFVPARTLRVVPGDVIGLTIPTWLPAFAKELDEGTAWRTSRSSKRCGNDAPAVHDRRGTARTYGCFFRKERILYRATMITDPKKSN